MTRAKDISKILTDADLSGTLDVAGNLTVDGGSIKLDGNYPTSTDNVALGDTALDSLTTGTRNVGIGSQALTANTDGNENTAVGRRAMLSNTSGTYNVGIGERALSGNTTGNQNTAIGKGSLTANTTANNNTAVGYSALTANTTGTSNVALGESSLSSNTTANNNTAIGQGAVTNNTTGASITGVGREVLYNNTTGENNSALGFQALSSNTTGNYNIAIGTRALNSNTTASGEVAVGYQAGYSQTVAGNNTNVGYRAGYSYASGAGNGFNTMYGYQAGYNNTGYSNTYLGHNSGLDMTSGNKNTIIGRFNGNQNGLDIRTISNYIVLSDGDGTPRFYINGNGHINSTDTYAHNVGGTVRDMYIRSDGYMGYNTSVRASKKNIEDLTDVSWLLQLSPKSFNYRKQNDDGTYTDEAIDDLSYGLIAEEVDPINPEICYYDDDNGTSKLVGVGYSRLITPMLKLIQDQQKAITQLEARIATLEGN